MERAPKKKASVEPSTKNSGDIVRLGALLFHARRSIDVVPFNDE